LGAGADGAALDFALPSFFLYFSKAPFSFSVNFLWAYWQSAFVLGHMPSWYLKQGTSVTSWGGERLLPALPLALAGEPPPGPPDLPLGVELLTLAEPPELT
jgi:hypothetical protein